MLMDHEQGVENYGVDIGPVNGIGLVTRRGLGLGLSIGLVNGLSTLGRLVIRRGRKLIWSGWVVLRCVGSSVEYNTVEKRGRYKVKKRV
ncbi:hypothetical protein Tco_0291563 [Tanacetum coccineum]